MQQGREYVLLREAYQCSVESHAALLRACVSGRASYLPLILARSYKNCLDVIIAVEAFIHLQSRPILRGFWLVEERLHVVPEVCFSR